MFEVMPPPGHTHLYHLFLQVGKHHYVGGLGSAGDANNSRSMDGGFPVPAPELGRVIALTVKLPCCCCYLLFPSPAELSPSSVWLAPELPCPQTVKNVVEAGRKGRGQEEACL